MPKVCDGCDKDLSKGGGVLMERNGLPAFYLCAKCYYADR